MQYEYIEVFCAIIKTPNERKVMKMLNYLFTVETGEEAGTYDLTGVVEGNNEFVVPIADLPGESGQELNWAVKLVGKPITDYTLINNLDDFNFSYTFNTVDNNPESDFFGRIYIGHRPGTADPNNGLWIYNPDYTKVNETVIKTRNGYAPGLAYDIDMARLPEILGTIAGADTVFAILREGASHEQVREFLARFAQP